MKAISSALAIIVATVFLPSQGEQKGAGKTEIKVDGIVWNFDYFEKTFGIKMKSGKKDEGKYYRILFEFTKDVENLTEMRNAIIRPKATGIPETDYLLFDEDNVIIGKSGLTIVEGELTGKKGDAFRLVLDVDVQGKKVLKVEARPKEVESKGKK